MDELQKLYDVLVREGYYTKSYDDFANQWNDEAYQDKVYGVVNRDGLYTKDKNSFLQKYPSSVKKKDQFRFDLESGSRPIQPTSGSKTSQFKPQKFGEFAPLETKKEEDKIEFAGALPESEQKVLDILSQKPSLKFVEDEDLKAYIRQNPKAWSQELVKRNPSLKDELIDGVLPGLMDEEPTLDNQGLKSIENANTLIDYTKSYDEAFDNMSKQSDAFTDSDVKANPKKYRDAVTNDYLTYLKMVNGEDSQTYLDVKERLDYYNSLGDKLYNDSAYADDLKRYQDIQKQALAKVSNNSYSKSIAIENNYDWKYFSKKSSNLDVKARNIEKQISELGIEEGKALSAPQKKKYEELMNQYNQVKQEFEKLSEETNITPEVIDQIRSQQGRMSSVMNTIDFIDNDKSSNAQSIRQYKAEMEANKKAQEEFYNTQDDSNLEAAGKGVARLGQQAAKTFVNGVFDIAKIPSIAGEAFGAKGYGWSDKLSETAENINSVVELYNPELDKSNFSGFMNLMNDAGQGLGSVAQFATSGAGASRIAKGLQLSEKGLMTANRAAQFTAAASTSTAGLYNELIDAGFTPEEAARYGIGGGIVMGAAEMIVPEDELIKNTIKQSFVSAIKSGATRKEAIENALGHLAKKSVQIVGNTGKETFEEGVGSLAESMSKEVASTMSGKKIDGIWDLKNFNTDALAGGQTAFILEMFKFGPRRGKYSNPFEEDLVGYLADNYNEMVETLSSTHPEDYDKISDRYKKLKDIHDGLKNTPAFNKLSRTDQNHVLAQAHAKQVILENIKQSGLSREGFKDEISSIDEDIFQTLNGLRSKDTWVDKSKTQKENAVQEEKTLSLLKISNDGKLQSNEDFVSKRSQIERGIKDEKKTNYSDQETERRLESTSSWLQAISGGDREKAENKANELLGEYLQKQEGGGDLPKNNDRRGSEISSQSDNGEISKSETGEMGTRSPQEPEYAGQSNRKSSTIDESGTFQTSYDSEAKGDEGKDVGISEVKRESVVQKTRKMFELPFSKKSSRIARDLQKMLYEATSNKEKNEIINQIKETFYESISKSSAEKILPREQGATSETGGQPQGVGQSVQGQEVTQEGGQEVSQEGVNRLNKETFAEDVTPEQKTKVEEQNQKDEDEAIDEIYDFNEEVKSIGTKDQFKQFLRSLSPTAAFSRIAWHNTSKPQLEPREGQYYTNTRKNAEDTYKQENTFPAIVFGNAPKKASFDEVQDVDTEAVKGEGADVVVTDDLSPAIGADMNYREFVPTSADQVIPIGTKENIEAFKAFVEQQKAAPEAKVEAEEKVQPEAQEEVQATPGEAKPTEEKDPEPEEQAKMEEEVAKSEAVSPKNVRELIGVYRKVFNLPYHKAFVSAMVSNKLIKQMAKRAGITTEQMYQRLQFKKASEKDLPKGVKMQVDAWHGSPYEFDKFTTEKMGTGEGAQAFGWGLYFTDLESIARGYAKALSKPNINQIQKKLIDDGLSNLAINDIVDFSEFYDYDYDAIIKALNDNQNFEAVEYLKNNKDLLKPLRSRNLYKVFLHEGKSPDQYTWLEWDTQTAREVKQKFSEVIKNENLKGEIHNIKLSDKYDVDSYDGGKTWKVGDTTKIGTEEEFVATFKDEKEAEKEAYKLNFVESNITGKDLYESLAQQIGQKEASMVLLENNIDGIKYPAESISRGATSETARGFNYVVFDENAVSIEEVVKFQKDANTARGAMMIGLDGQAIIYALTDANASTPLHELAHVFEHYLTKEEKAKIIKAAKTTRWTRETSEYFARGFEKYLAEGKSSDPIFEKFKQFLLDIYKAIKGSPIDVKLNKDMKAIYATMLGEDLTEDLGETLDENVENSASKEEEMAKSAVEELMTAKKKRGAKKIDEMKNVKEKYGQMGKKLDYIDRNFDKLIDKLGIVKSCWLE
jgi:hypothetical protein